MPYARICIDVKSLNKTECFLYLIWNQKLVSTNGEKTSQNYYRAGDHLYCTVKTATTNEQKQLVAQQLRDVLRAQRPIQWMLHTAIKTDIFVILPETVVIWPIYHSQSEANLRNVSLVSSKRKQSRSFQNVFDPFRSISLKPLWTNIASLFVNKVKFWPKWDTHSLTQ